MTIWTWRRRELPSFRDLACGKPFSLLHRFRICRRPILPCPSKLSRRGYRCMARPLSSPDLRRISFFTRIGSCSSMTSPPSIIDQVRSCHSMTMSARLSTTHTDHTQQQAPGKLTMRQCTNNSLMRVKRSPIDTYQRLTKTVFK